MPKITLEVSEELSQQIAQIGNERLPELLALSLQQPAIPTQVYQYILNFLASNPTPQQIAEFKPTPEMQDRLRTLLARNKAGNEVRLKQLSGLYADVCEFSKDDLQLDCGGNPGEVLTCLRVYTKINQQEYPGRVIFRTLR